MEFDFYRYIVNLQVSTNLFKEVVTDVNGLITRLEEQSAKFLTKRCRKTRFAISLNKRCPFTCFAVLRNGLFCRSRNSKTTAPFCETLRNNMFVDWIETKSIELKVSASVQ